MPEHPPSARPPNRLAGETSPYLLQHAHNPVDWYPWGPEALERARREDRPILLSIGYSACHWCHVMERESFEDLATAELMNRHFVCVKVDREERPDLDAIYMQAVQMMTRHGGWPMTVFLTPDGKPFWGGTYFPPEDRQGMPGFKRVLASIADAWERRREDVLRSGGELAQHLQQQAQAAPGALSADVLDAASRNLMAQIDPVNGGFGNAPKFPQPMAIELLLRQWHRTGAEAPLGAAIRNLEAMARGGIYDHLGGGFHRYSVDDHWLVPHFEKMLYDNAQLARAYLMGYQATGNAFFRKVAEQTLDYVLRDMTDPSGGFYSTEDADSEGEEGKFYVWRPADVMELLGEEDGRLFAAYYDVTDQGNFEQGASILHVQATPEQVSQRLGVTDAALLEALERGRVVLFQARGKRVRPARDEKVLAAWNGMMLRAFAEAARVLDRQDYLEAAVRNGAFLLNEMRDSDGRLFRTWKRGHEARLNGYLEDYANVADGLVALYEATFDRRWLTAACDLADAILARFSDDESGGFFDTSDDHEQLITRPRELFDNATPSGTAVTADVMLRLALLTANHEYHHRAQRAIEMLAEPAARYPLGFARLLSAADFFLGRPKEIAIVGDLVLPSTLGLLSVVYERFLPNKVVAGTSPGDPDAESIPLLEQRSQVDGKATAYVCEQYACLVPVTSPDGLRSQLQAA